MQKDALKKTCYIGGAGAFGVFFRWLQTQVAFNDEGLPNPSVFNVLVPLVIVAAGVLFFRFARGYKNGRYYLPSSFSGALRCEGPVYTALRWVIGVMMCLGALALFAACEADKNVGFYRAVAVLGFISGAAFPFFLGETLREEPRYKLVCVLGVLPMLLFAMWLVTCYKVNSINGVLWSYGIEIVACCFLLLAFFSVGGFAFSSPDPWHSIFYCMFAAFLAFVCLADGRYMGMQIMLIAAAEMLMLYNWIMISNLRRRKAEEAAPVEDDGFERL